MLLLGCRLGRKCLLVIAGCPFYPTPMRVDVQFFIDVKSERVSDTACIRFWMPDIMH
ncbi:WSSV116 [White spot syndrome virus]|uniref:WSSV116 n=1 Tax=White spot syndrome virus TaxID=342409 RepID=A0A2I6SBM6_9VIRU|nr:WSSV116 [White spot syndrome virus]